ncbi:MAG: hypothetical protein ACR2M3_16070 [Thermomicrobiales bacterium]
MSDQYPQLHNLVRVIPVAQSQTQDDTTLTFLSIDCYADGWVANLRVIRPDSQGYPLFMFYPKRHPDPVTHYGGKGASILHLDNGPNWYLSYVFYPALRREELPLEFDVPVMRFTDRPRREAGALVAEVPGPWRFVVSVLSGTDAVQTTINSERWQPSNLDQRRDRQRETLPVYGPVFDDVLDILYRYDPIIAWMDPLGAEWYTPVTYLILDRLPQAQSAEDVRNIALDEFRKRWKATFHEEFAERFDEVGELIWQAWRRRQAGLPTP